jgi:hypothetical protein
MSRGGLTDSFGDHPSETLVAWVPSWFCESDKILLSAGRDWWTIDSVGWLPLPGFVVRLGEMFDLAFITDPSIGVKGS